MVYQSENTKSPSISFDTEIQLGNPKHQCQSFGICKIEPALYKEELLTEPKNTNTINANVVFEKNRMVVFFKKTKMAKETEQKFFGGKLFTILSAIEVPPFISEKLKTPYTINVGEYPITKEEHFYQVIF